MNTLGTPTKTTFLKGIENHKLHEEFEVEGLTHSLTFGGAVITGNVIDGFVGGNAINAVTFITDNDTTLAAVAAAIAAQPGVKSATVVDNGSNDRVIIVVPKDQVAGVPLTGFVITGGASQTTITVATVNKKIFAGMPVEINTTSGKIQPLTPGTTSTTYIGTAIHDAVEGELCTVALNGKAILYAKSSVALTPGPVSYVSWDAVANYGKYTGTGVTATNIMGWSLDEASGADITIRVIVK